MPEEPPPHRRHVVIVGGGFGGLNAAIALRHADVDVTLVDRRNFHLFQPLLYQVATGALSPANIASPLRGVLRHQKNTQVLLAEVVGFDVENKVVQFADGEIAYDDLIVAAGSTHSYFGHEEWSKCAPGLKTIEDATEIRRRILYAFEHSERETNPEARKAWMTFVVVGGGPTGVELAGALSEIALRTLKDDFRNIDPSATRVILADGSPGLLSGYPEKLSARAESDLRSLKVDVRNETRVTDVAEGHVILTRETDGHAETIETWTVLWAAGVQASPLARELAQACGQEADRAGRISVGGDCRVPGHPNIFVIGDMARHTGADGKTLPGVAQVAIQQARYVARRIIAGQGTQETQAAFSYRDLGMMATIGRSKAVAKVGNWKFQGFIAWSMWLFVHLMSLVQFQNRLLVISQWAWNYITFTRSARLITGKILPLKVRVAHIGPNASIGEQETPEQSEQQSTTHDRNPSDCKPKPQQPPTTIETKS